MKDEEKNLIENLFHRLKNAELNVSERDDSADCLIKKLVKEQPCSPYYMAQTILIQETAIKKMSSEIEELRHKIQKLNTQDIKKKPSFLSSFFKSESNSTKQEENSNAWKSKESLNPNNRTYISGSQSVPISTSTTAPRNPGFLSNALQTATGVAGGMILGNILMNVFNHPKLESEVFDTIKNPSEEHSETHCLNNNTDRHNNLVNYEDTELNDSSNSENFNDIDYVDDFDVDNDNFV